MDFTIFSRVFAIQGEYVKRINNTLIKSIIMKTFLSVFILAITFQAANAQLTAKAVCPPFKVDVMDGNINELYPRSAIEEIKKTFPCATDIVEQGSDAKCAGVFFKDKGVSFYSERNYMEIGENFKGKMTPALMGVSRSSLFTLLGRPKLTDTNWEAFQMGYGTLVLYYNKAGKVNKLQISSKSTEALKLCQ